MPTIDQLDLAVVAADDDMLPVSQGGAARRVTRAQLLAGTQSELALTPGLLGRTSSGFGPPGRVGVGGGLRLADGVLWSPPPFAVAALPKSSAAGSADLVPVSQAGQDRSVPLSALLSVPGIDVSGQVVRATFGAPRKISDWISDTLSVETFGAVGDGVTDDSAAFVRALASGLPIRLGPKTYRVDGQWSVSVRAVLLGTPGMTRLRRSLQTGGAWISVSAPSFIAAGVVFDAGSAAGDSWGVLIGPGCTETLFEDCTFANATGRSLGTGLTIQARDGLIGQPSSHTIRNCTFRDNDVHGLWMQAVAGALVEGCAAHRNGGFGLCLDYNDPEFGQLARQSTITRCRTWGNQRGISVGNYNETNSEPPRWGLVHPDAQDILVADNVCVDNAAYGIAVSGVRIKVCRNHVLLGNQSSNACGILVNACRSTINGNDVCGPGQFGIDAGGCLDCEIADNLVQDCSVGINCGGGKGVRVTSNRLFDNAWGITAYQVETDGQGRNFGIACRDLCLDHNVIGLRDSNGGGVLLSDGPENVIVTDNQFVSGSESLPAQALWAHTDSVVVHGNRWNGQARLICNPVDDGDGDSSELQMPDVLDGGLVTVAAKDVGGIMGQHQAAMSGQISFIRVTNGGDGYSYASISIGGPGAGARAQPYLRDGVLIGVALSSGGTGYDPSTVNVAVIGDGQGAEARASVGLPVPDGRRITLQCNVPVRFKRAGSKPYQDNWTGVDIPVPAGSEIVWAGMSGGWQAVAFSCSDYVLPATDGSVSLRSASGDVSLRPGIGGQVRIVSEAEPIGFSSSLGRGSPEGLVAAPPGSDYRNLDGGIGTTLWLKRTGNDSSGWTAIA